MIILFIQIINQILFSQAMVKDKNNHYQETASQLKQKIKQFKKRPAYLVPYVKTRGLLATSDTVENNV